MSVFMQFGLRKLKNISECLESIMESIRTVPVKKIPRHTQVNHSLQEFDFWEFWPKIAL